MSRVYRSDEQGTIVASSDGILLPGVQILAMNYAGDGETAGAK